MRRTLWWLALVLLLSPSASAKGSTHKKPLSEYGSISLGHPGAGILMNAVAMPEGNAWTVTVPSHGYGTQETIDGLVHCIGRVHEAFPNSPKVMLGSISAKNGGRLPPHRTHRTGRDADVYFFRQPDAKWVEAATETDIDLPRTWALLRCFITDTDVDHVLIVSRVQRWLLDYALGAGEPKAWVQSLFDLTSKNPRAAVRHMPGHVAHMHVRFTSPKARQLGNELYDRLVQEGRVKAGYTATPYTVKKGDALSTIAKRFSTSVDSIRRYNGLKSTVIVVGQRLNIPVKAPLRDVRAPVVVPKRRLPPN